MVSIPATSFLTRSVLFMTIMNVALSVVHQTPLPYPPNALEPYISAESLEWHYR